MNEEKSFEKLREKQLEMAGLPLQNFGRYSLLYREMASYFKIAPWRVGIILGVAGTLFLVYILGPSFVKLASLIGKGF